MSDPSSASRPPSTPPPGWYPDASGENRWWDGQAWGAASPAPSNLPATQAAGGTTDEKTLATLAQVLGIFTGFLGPLVIYLMAKPDQPFAKHHAAEALNFQITFTIAFFVCFALVFVFIGIFLLPLVWIGALVLEVIAALAANKGEWYRYPVNLRLVSGAQG